MKKILLSMVTVAGAVVALASPASATSVKVTMRSDCSEVVITAENETDTPVEVIFYGDATVDAARAPGTMNAHDSFAVMTYYFDSPRTVYLGGANFVQNGVQIGSTGNVYVTPPAGCYATTTTVAATTTTVAPTTTVAATTTTAAETSTTTTDDTPDSVAVTTTIQLDTALTVPGELITEGSLPQRLPTTGGRISNTGYAGIALLLAGIGLVVIGRRKERAA